MTKQTLQTKSDGEQGEGVETKRKNFFLSQGKYMRRSTNITFPSSPLLQIVVVGGGGVADCCWKQIKRKFGENWCNKKGRNKIPTAIKF